MKPDLFSIPTKFAMLGVMLLALLLAGCGSPAVTTQTQAPASDGGEASYPEIARVSLEDAKSAFDAGDAVFVDVRSKDAYDISHISGALSLPLNELESRIAELDPNQWIITYCT